MLSIIYVSKVKNRINSEQLTLLADRAAKNNHAYHITGMLAYNGEHFMQLIEGEASHVESLLECIGRDKRHSDLVIIRRKENEPRECPDWSMRYYILPVEGAGAADEIFRSMPNDFQSDTRMIFTSFATLKREAA